MNKIIIVTLCSLIVSFSTLATNSTDESISNVDLKCYEGVEQSPYGHPLSASIRFKVLKRNGVVIDRYVARANINDNYDGSEQSMSCSVSRFLPHEDLNMDCAGFYSFGNNGVVVLKIRTSSDGKTVATWKTSSAGGDRGSKEITRNCKLVPSKY